MLCLLDTNIWIYLFEGRPQIASLINRIESGQVVPVLHPVVFSEVLGWQSLSVEQEDRVRSYFAALKMLDISMDDWEQIISWRQEGIRKKMPDLLIAATARHHEVMVYTHNLTDFASLGIRVEDPWVDLPQ